MPDSDDLGQTRKDFNSLFEQSFGRRATVADREGLFQRVFGKMHTEERSLILASQQQEVDLNEFVPEVQQQMVPLTRDVIRSETVEEVIREMGEEEKKKRIKVSKKKDFMAIVRGVTLSVAILGAAASLGVLAAGGYEYIRTMRHTSRSLEEIPLLEHGMPPVVAMPLPELDILPVEVVTEPKHTPPYIARPVEARPVGEPVLETLTTEGEIPLLGGFVRSSFYNHWLDDIEGMNHDARTRLDVFSSTKNNLKIRAWALLKGGNDYLVISKREVKDDGIRFAHVYKAGDSDDLENLLRDAKPKASLFFEGVDEKRVDYGSGNIGMRHFDLSAHDSTFSFFGKAKDLSSYRERALQVLNEFKVLYKPME
ncbi:hypothetical protein HY501_01810 [Candidatus Woesearchaeota archaeon]|nr:hypothetical protein [Candidatus Woesearchaeota archaeon]